MIALPLTCPYVQMDTRSRAPGCSAVAARRGSARSFWKRKGHRYDRVLADISGQDIEVHARKLDQAIACVRNWLSDHRRAGAAPLPGSKALFEDYKRSQREAVAIVNEHRLDPLGKLSHSDFLFVVRAWIESEAERKAIS
jgi:hypothetical protein